MKKALIGYGGHAREVMSQMGVKLTCFVDDEYVVYGTRPLSEFDPKEYALMVAVADSRDRFDIIQKLKVILDQKELLPSKSKEHTLPILMATW